MVETVFSKYLASIKADLKKQVGLMSRRRSRSNSKSKESNHRLPEKKKHRRLPSASESEEGYSDTINTDSQRSLESEERIASRTRKRTGKKQ